MASARPYCPGRRPLGARGIVSQPCVEEIVRRAKQVMAETGEVLLEPLPGGKPGQRRIKPAEWPDPAFVDVGVRGDLSEFDDAHLAERDTFGGEIVQQKSSTQWPA